MIYPYIHKDLDVGKLLIVGAVAAIGVVYWLPKPTATAPLVSVESQSSQLSGSEDSSLSETADPNSFDGDPCTSDCSGHEAGYNWA